MTLADPRPHAPRAATDSTAGIRPWLIACSIAAAALLAVADSVRADPGMYTLSIANEFSPHLWDVGRTKITISPPTASTNAIHFGCTPAVTQAGNQFIVTTTVHPGPPVSSDYCDAAGQIFLGPLVAGDYELSARVVSEGGAVLANFPAAFTVDVRGEKCNVDPFINDLIAAPVSGEYTFHMRFDTDPAYRAQFGDIAYVDSLNVGSATTYVALAFPTLQDPVRELDRLRRTGEFSSEGVDGTICFATPPADSIGTVVEYHNTILDHYFMTPNAGEQAAIDAGQVGPGWVRTNNTFKAVVSPGCPSASEGGFHPVYRFAGIADIGPNSHFFTLSQDECAIVRDRVEWHWAFEGAPFWAVEPIAGTCSAETRALFRAYNNGIGGIPNHRYSTDGAVIDSMVAQGWVSEGIVMCVLP